MIGLKKKLLIASDCFPPRWDGIARFLVDIVPRLTDDFEITIIVPDFAGEATEIADVKIIKVPLMKHITVGDYKPAQIKSDLIENLVKETDVIWVHTLAAIGGTTIQLANKYKKHYAYYVHSIDWMLVYRSLSKNNLLRKPFYWYTKWYAKKSMSKADLIMVPSSEVEELMAWNKVRAPCKIVKMGIDTNKFIPAPDKNAAKAALGIDPSFLVVGYVGRIGREKDVLTLLRAFSDVQKKLGNVKLLIVGDGITSYKQQLSENKNVILVGSQNHVVPYLQAMDVYVLPSLLETTSLSTLEAMSCEVPVICTPVGLVKEYIREKENGMFFPIGNSLVLSLKLEWLLSNTQSRLEIGHTARRTVIDEFSWEQTIQHVKMHLKKL